MGIDGDIDQYYLNVIILSLFYYLKFLVCPVVPPSLLKQWTEPGSCMGFMEQSKPGIGITILIGAESRNIIAYTISNSTGRYILFVLETTR